MIKNLDNINRARLAFNQLFSSTSPFEPAGRIELPVRVVLFPTDSYHLDNGQFKALISAIQRKSERSFFISEVESEDPFDPNAQWKRQHWECTNPTFDEYASLIIGVDNALYSENGSWGVLISHELHALLVCDEQFWQVFKVRYSDSENDFAEFIEYWHRIREEAGTDTKWLPTFVAHLTYPTSTPTLDL
jgi:hypothetical protein